MKNNGVREPFSRSKLLGGMRKACEKRPVTSEILEQSVDEIADELEQEGYREIPSNVIGAKVMKRLEGIDQVAYVRYASVYRDFREASDFADFIEEAGKTQRSGKKD